MSIFLSLAVLLGITACSSRTDSAGLLKPLGGAHFASASLSRGSLIAGFTVKGVGNPDKSGYEIGFVATAEVTATCANKGGHAASGVNDVVVSKDLPLSATGSIDHNGTFTGTVTLEDITNISNQDICKNHNWTITKLQTRWTSAVLTVHKPEIEPDDKVCFVITEDDGTSIEFSTVGCTT